MVQMRRVEVYTISRGSNSVGLACLTCNWMVMSRIAMFRSISLSISMVVEVNRLLPHNQSSNLYYHFLARQERENHLVGPLNQTGFCIS